MITTDGFTEPLLLDVRGLTIGLTRDPMQQPVRQVSFRIPSNRAVALVGESGSGKSILSRAVMRLLPSEMEAQEGKIFFQDQDILGIPEQAVRKLRAQEIAMIFQDPLSSLNPVHAVGDQVGETFRKWRGLDRRRARAEGVRLMDAVRIPNAAGRANDYPHQFSGGMRQRAMIAMAIGLEPRLLIADEPTTALDVTVQFQIMGMLRELRKARSMALLFVTHDLRLAADVVEDIIVMYAGRIVETGPFNDVIQGPKHPYTHALIRSIPKHGDRGKPLLTIEGSPPSLRSRPSGCAFRLRCPRAQDMCVTADPPLIKSNEESREVACHFPLGVAK